MLCGIIFAPQVLRRPNKPCAQEENVSGYGTVDSVEIGFILGFLCPRLLPSIDNITRGLQLDLGIRDVGNYHHVSQGLSDDNEPLGDEGKHRTAG